MKNNPLIQCQQMIPAELSFEYTGETLDLNISHGEFISIVGPNYCGKARWLKSICGLEDLHSGKVYIYGADTSSLSVSEWTRSRMKIAYIHADTALMSAVNGLVNTIVPAIYHRIDQNNDKQILAATALALLEEIDPDINLDDLPAYISKEHKFKIAVARALMLKPDLLALNNPFAHFNKDSKSQFIRFLENQRKKGLSLLIVSHDVYYALNTSDKIIYVDRESLYQFNSKQAMLNCNIPAVDDFLAHNMIRNEDINNRPQYAK